LQLVDCSDVMMSPVECLNLSETVSRLRRIVDDPHSHNGYPVVEDYCPASVRIMFYSMIALQGAPIKTVHFWTLITLQRLVIERRVICQKFA